MTGAGSSGATDESGVRALLDVVGRVIAPAGVLTAVLYYFGFMREQALFAHFGIDLGSAGFSTTDFLVRSAGTMFVPLVVVLLLAVVAAFAHHGLVLAVSSVPPERRWAPWTCLAALAVGVLVVGVDGLLTRADPALGPLAPPIALGSGAVLLQYAVDSAAGATRAGVPAALAGTRGLRRAATVALVLVSLFWLTSDVAQRRGTAAARAIEVSLPLQAQAVVYSEQDLHLPGYGIGVTELDGDGTGLRFRYNGLRTLLHSDGRWFLLPVGWTRDNGSTVIVLHDDPGRVRVDLAP